MTVELGNRISAYMKRADLTQRQLSKKTLIPEAKISRVRKGELELSVDEAIKLRDVLVPSDEKVEFTFSSRGLTDAQVEETTGKPMRDLNEIRHAKRKLFDSKGRQFGVIRY